jgi:hypothetical protein
MCGRTTSVLWHKHMYITFKCYWVYTYVVMKINRSLKKRTNASSRSPLLLDLHQCRQCGLVYRVKTEPVFSWDRTFMVDKCDVCRDFRYDIKGGTFL